MTPAANARPKTVYKASRSTGGVHTFYVLAPPRSAKALVKRLSNKGDAIRTDEILALRAAREALAGRGVLFVRHMRGTDPLTKERWELTHYVGLPLDYPLRAVKRKPGFK